MTALRTSLAIFFIFGLLSFAQAQTEKGSLQLGFRQLPGFGISDNGGWRLSFQPNVGYFVADNWVVGGSPVFQHAVTVSEGNAQTLSTNWGALAYSRYYFLKNRFRLFGEASTGISWQRTENSSGNTRSWSTEGPEFSAGLGFGASYFLGKNIALEATLPVMRFQEQPGGNSNFSLFSKSPSLGIQIFLR